MADVTTATLSTVGLIFGGCCSNVFALEAILKNEADSGLLITFFQFLLTTIFAYPTQSPLLHPSSSPNKSNSLLLKPRAVPLQKWAFMASMFFAVNMLNNWAFAFNISVPVHIILRSFGSVTTMAAGWLRGKRYSGLQVGSVALLTVGVCVSAWADAVNKGKDLSTKTPVTTSSFTAGLSLLLLAQLLSAYMGIYVQDTYATHAASRWTENLFYSHFLSLPFFLPLSSTLQRQYSALAATPPLSTSEGLRHLPASVRGALSDVPVGVALLLVNAATQLACISGVNLLTASASAVTVTIVLNVRKLVSFVLSTLIFGHQLPGMMVVGAAMVFGAGALYGWESSVRIPARRKAEQVGKERKLVGGVKEL